MRIIIAFLMLFSTSAMGDADMKCIMINYDMSPEHAQNLVEKSIRQVPVEDVPGLFCQDHLFYPPNVTFSDDGTFYVGLSIQETRGGLPRLHRFIFHWSVKEGATDKLLDVNYGTLSP